MQFYKSIIHFGIIGASIAAASLPARALVITYTDRDAFLAAIGESPAASGKAPIQGRAGIGGGRQPQIVGDIPGSEGADTIAGRIEDIRIEYESGGIFELSHRGQERILTVLQ